jgi:hypothetical protein
MLGIRPASTCHGRKPNNEPLGASASKSNESSCPSQRLQAVEPGFHILFCGSPQSDELAVCNDFAVRQTCLFKCANRTHGCLQNVGDLLQGFLCGAHWNPLSRRVKRVSMRILYISSADKLVLLEQRFAKQLRQMSGELCLYKISFSSNLNAHSRIG